MRLTCKLILKIHLLSNFCPLKKIYICIDIFLLFRYFFDSFYTVFRFFVPFILLLSGFGIFGGKLQCTYGTWSDILWPEFHICNLKSVDLSAKQSSESYYFSGNPIQKNQVTVICFYSGSSISQFEWFGFSN